MLGNTIDKDDDHPEDGPEYENMGRFFKLLLFSYRNSVGDVQVPDNEYWQLFLKKNNGQGEYGVSLMTFMLWFIWFGNNIYMVIILLNFMISIVSKAHDDAINLEI